MPECHATLWTDFRVFHGLYLDMEGLLRPVAKPRKEIPFLGQKTSVQRFVNGKTKSLSGR